MVKGGFLFRHAQCGISQPEETLNCSDNYFACLKNDIENLIGRRYQSICAIGTTVELSKHITAFLFLLVDDSAIFTGQLY